MDSHPAAITWTNNTARVRTHAQHEEFKTVATKEDALGLVVAAIDAAERALADSRVALTALAFFTDPDVEARP